MKATTNGGQALRAGILWRAIVVLAAAAAAVLAFSATAFAVPQSEASWAKAGRGALSVASGIAAAGIAAHLLRKVFANVGLGAGESFVPADAPAAVSAIGAGVQRNRRAIAGLTIGAGLLLGLAGTGIDIGLGAREDVATVDAANVSDTAEAEGEDPVGEAQAAAEAALADAGTTAGDAVKDATGVDVQGGALGGYIPGGDDNGAGAGPGGGPGGGGPGGGGGGTPPTKPDPKDIPGIVCDALKGYEGNVNQLLDTLDIDPANITATACDAIEDFLDTVDGLLPPVTTPTVPVTVPTVPVTVPTVPVTVPTVPVTVPPVTVPTVPSLPGLPGF